MTKEHALSEFKRLYDDIDKDNHLFVGTIPPEMIEVAINAIEHMIEQNNIVEKLNSVGG